MKLGYTIAFSNQFFRLDEIYKLGENIFDYWVYVLPLFVEEGEEPELTFAQRDSALLKIWEFIDIMKDLKRDKERKWVFKIQFHPKRIEGCEPKWWPGYLTSDKFAKRYANLVSGLYRWVRDDIVRREAEFAIVGVEIAGLCKKINWLEIKKQFPIPIVYGSNFWQPLHWKYRKIIEKVRDWGWDEWLLGNFLSEFVYNISPEKRRWFLDNIIYPSYQGDAFWSFFDYQGLSNYFYPTMTDEKAIEKKYKKYIVWLKLGWFKIALTYFSYPKVVRKWVGNKKLIVTESGVLYNAPIARNERLVKKWMVETLKQFNFAEKFTAWDEVEFPWIIEATEEFKKKRSW